ncbi:MAG: VWA domain-containing protein [Candidatus Eisenbacteria bacterium]|uniref:VWA domain-containing protein n=1 Tax=Eiseniibacteriota bacterium TaxID=2212470 RepID=A0A538TBQ4_UNCEI|nr:MAG: VWA domain-containing protein [Candidatus Eisenbacteria bacterium]
MRFAEPGYLFLFLPFALALWLARRRPVWRDPELSFSSLHALPPTLGLRARASGLLPALRLLAIALVLLAAARPQGGREVREVVSEGINIMLAIDLSGSMRSEDFRPRNRLYVAKEVAKEFVRGRQQDRIGLVAFAGESELISPLTLDYEGLASLIDGLDFGQLPDGTAVGAAIAQAAERLSKAPGKSRVLILLTDGINNAGAIDPITAAKLAKAVGVRIYAIGAGTQGAAPFPVDDPILGRHYVWVASEVDEATLQAVARETGGRYFRATSAELLSQVYREIGALEPSRVETRSYTKWAEMGPLAMSAGLALLGIELLMGFTVWRRYP